MILVRAEAVKNTKNAAEHKIFPSPIVGEGVSVNCVRSCQVRERGEITHDKAIKTQKLHTY